MRRKLLALVCASGLLAVPVQAKVLSLNLCADELLLSLAPADQIAGLSPFAHQASAPPTPQNARAFPAFSGTAEEALWLKPSLVVSSRFMKQQTLDMLQAHGMRLHLVSVPKTIEEAQASIRNFAEAIGHPDRARGPLDRINAAMARLEAQRQQKPLRVLPLSRRGWVDGEGSILWDIMKRAGLVHAAQGFMAQTGGVLGLEAVLALKPDVLLLADHAEGAEDQGSAMLAHPAIRALYPPERQIRIPASWTVCGGPSIALAIERLADILKPFGRQ